MRACAFSSKCRGASRICSLTVAIVIAITANTDRTANAASSSADLNQTSARLSDSAFAMLNGINATTTTGQTNPMLGALAGFAADAQALSKAITSSDHIAASAAVGRLQSDRKQIDGLIASGAGALPSAEWKAASSKLDLITASIQPTAAPPVEAVRSGTGSATNPTNGDSRGPRIEIESTEADSEGTTHLRGYIRGSALKSAGIYSGGRELKALDVGHVPGAQRLNFDIAVEQMQPDMTVRASDTDDHEAIARLSPTPAVKTIEPMAPFEGTEISPGSGKTRNSDSDLIDESGSEAAPMAPEAGEMPSSGTTTAEIPPLGMTAPSAVHVHRPSSSSPHGLEIEIARITEINPEKRTYEVVGQIAGLGIKRAGIYVDGTEIASIPIGAANGNGTFDFDQTFRMGGNTATIRVYAKSARYVERAVPIAVTSGPMTSASFPMVVASNNPNQIGIQIASLRPISAQNYLVNGTISGSNLASAGLYQNGTMVQQFAIAAGLLSSLAPQMFREVNFSAQFNGAAGPAVVRVFDTSGREIDQPVMVAGSAHGAPYANPASGVYGPSATGFGSPPYGSSYGTGPYGSNPYSTQPAPSGTKWWQQLLR
jgi:hypothetical protein